MFLASMLAGDHIARSRCCDESLACHGLETEQARLYCHLIYLSLDEAARRALREMMPPNYEYQVTSPG